MSPAKPVHTVSEGAASSPTTDTYTIKDDNDEKLAKEIIEDSDQIEQEIMTNDNQTKDTTAPKKSEVVDGEEENEGEGDGNDGSEEGEDLDTLLKEEEQFKRERYKEASSSSGKNSSTVRPNNSSSATKTTTANSNSDNTKAEDGKNANTKPEKMRLYPCHTFHTNPIIKKQRAAIAAAALHQSKRQVSSTSSNISKGSSGSSTNIHNNTINVSTTDNLQDQNNIIQNHASAASSSINSNQAELVSKTAAQNAKSLKRKQRLAASLGNPHPTKPPGGSTSSSQHTIGAATGNIPLGNGVACHAAWSPSPHYARNHVELLAISSPSGVANASGSSGNGGRNGGVGGGSASSSVYVLVFEEGAFRNMGVGDSLWSDLGMLFGLPPITPAIPPPTPTNNEDEKCADSINQNYLDFTDCEEEDEEGYCGLKRSKFKFDGADKDGADGSGDINSNGNNAVDDYLQGSSVSNHNNKAALNNNNNNAPAGSNNNQKKKNKKNKNMGGNDYHMTSVQSGGIAGGIAAQAPKDFFQKVAQHLYDEVANIGRVFIHEIFGDGRILNTSFSTDDGAFIHESHSSIGGTTLVYITVSEIHLNVSFAIKKQKLKQNQHEDNSKTDPKSVHYSNSSPSSKSTKTSFNTMKQQQLYQKLLEVKPTLVFQLALPYTNHNANTKHSNGNHHHHHHNSSVTYMEVINLEWNEDGTVLSITQRRKGAHSTSSSGIVSAGSGGGAVSTSSRTNKKKGHTSSSSSSSSNHNPSISGSTAVSFWSVPEWLLVDYEGEFYNQDEEDEQRIRDDLEDNKNTTLMENDGFDDDEEEEEDDRCKTFFPMWEWYLTNYLFRDELLMSPSVNPGHPNLLSNVGFGGSSGKDNSGGGTIVGGANAMALVNGSNCSANRSLAQNIVVVQACPLELHPPPSLPSGSGSSGRHGKKGGSRGTGRSGLSSGGHSDTSNASVLMNGDISCLFWEEYTPVFYDQLEQQLLEKALTNENGDADSSTNERKRNSRQKKKDDQSEVSKDGKKERDKAFTPPSSKWVVMGTSKGQVVLHNTSASCMAHQTKKFQQKKMFNSLMGNAPPTHTFSTHARTIVVPCKHKKRITCGAWVDNLLVFGSLGSGQLTVATTFPKSKEGRGSDNTKDIITAKKTSKGLSEEIFKERVVKVLGNIVLPGGRDAFQVQIGSVEDEYDASTILSVNCEGRCLLFYTFPKIFDEGSGNNQAPITASAIEISFSINGGCSGSPGASISSDDVGGGMPPISIKGTGAICGNIVQHFLVPNTCLVLVAFSAGYFALVDWRHGIIISDAEVLSKKIETLGKPPMANATCGGMDDDPFLLDVAFHSPSCTFAGLTQSGHVVAFQIRILNGCHGLKAGDCTCKTGLVVNTKTHTHPKTKSSGNNKSSSSSTSSPCREGGNIDRGSMALLATIDTLCSQKIDNVPFIPTDGRKAGLLDFSADGECISVSLGDESVSILRLKVDDYEKEREKAILAESIFMGRDQLIILAFLSLFLTTYWFWEKSSAFILTGK